MLCRATKDRWVMVETLDKMWSTGEGNGKPHQYSCLENPMNSMRRQNDRTLNVTGDGSKVQCCKEQYWFYEDLQDLLELTSKKDVLFIIGDWNAKVGSQETPGVTSKFGLGVQNEAGQRLIEFCQENALVIANTLFQQHRRRLYTWTSPDGQY